jgi:hypothetical protein
MKDVLGSAVVDSIKEGCYEPPPGDLDGLHAMTKILWRSKATE